jgi:hypothetical protein
LRVGDDGNNDNSLSSDGEDKNKMGQQQETTTVVEGDKTMTMMRTTRAKCC